MDAGGGSRLLWRCVSRWLGFDDVAHVLTAGDLGGSGSHDGAAASQVCWNVNAEAAELIRHGADRESFLVNDNCLQQALRLCGFV